MVSHFSDAILKRFTLDSLNVAHLSKQHQLVFLSISSFSRMALSFPPTLQEIVDFHQHDTVLPDRPYTWSNTLRTFDGVIHLLDETQIGQVGMEHIPGPGDFYKADFRLLMGSWMMSDAILFTSETVNAEPNMPCTIVYPDLQAYRSRVLGKKDPIVVVLCKKGYLLPTSPIFNVEQVIVFTCEANKHLVDPRVHVQVVDLQDGHLNLVQVMKRLKEYGIDTLDICGGGVLINALLEQGLLDEMKNTIAGQIVGPQSQSGLSRPHLFPHQRSCFTCDNSPLIAWKKVHLLGEHFIFMRGKLTYRHLP